DVLMTGETVRAVHTESVRLVAIEAVLRHPRIEAAVEGGQGRRVGVATRRGARFGGFGRRPLLVRIVTGRARALVRIVGRHARRRLHGVTRQARASVGSELGQGDVLPGVPLHGRAEAVARGAVDRQVAHRAELDVTV